MKIKVRNKIYDGEKEPVMVILNPVDKFNIVNMAPHTKKYCVYPNKLKYTDDNFKGIKAWMEEE